MSTAPTPGFLKPGGFIDSYRIVKMLGEGANGRVLLVKRQGRRFALKLTQRREVSDDERKTNARMLRELGCLIHLEHSNIIRPRAWGHFPDLIGDYSYLVLDYVDGWTLAEWLEKTRPTFARVARVFVKLADALDYMHRQGVFHRDISLTNVLIRKEDGEPFIVDFGAGDFANAPELTEGPLPPGTNRFRAPEAVTFWNEHRLDYGARYSFQAKDDRYALAVCLYDALTDAETAKDTEQRATRRILVNVPSLGPPPAPRAVNPRVPEGLSALVAREMAHDTAQRLPTLEALRCALEALAYAGGADWEAPAFAPAAPDASGPPAIPATWRWGRLRRVAAVSAVVVAAAVALLLLRESSPPARTPGSSAPSGVPHARMPEVPPSSPAAPPVAEVPSSASMPPAQKEAPTVRAPAPASRQFLPKPPGQSVSRPSLTPEFLARCAGLGLVAATKLGCPAPQVRPEREECPAEAVQYMENMGLWDGQELNLTLDVNQPGPQSARGVYRTGKYMGEVRNDFGRVLKEGWRVEGYVWTEGERIVMRFTRLFVPPGAKDANGDPMPREVPVCIQLGRYGWEPLEGSKPGAVVLPRSINGRFIFGEWTQP